MIFSQDRQVNFSRTVWITFHWRGTISSVSVTSSPSFASLPSQTGHAQGAWTAATNNRHRQPGVLHLTDVTIGRVVFKEPEIFNSIQEQSVYRHYRAVITRYKLRSSWAPGPFATQRILRRI